MLNIKFEVKWAVNEVIGLFTNNFVKRDLIRIGLSLNETQRRYNGECIFAKNDKAFIAIGKSFIFIGSKDDVYRIDKKLFDGVCYFNNGLTTLANDNKFASVFKHASKIIFAVVWRFKVKDLSEDDVMKLMNTNW